MSHSDPQTRYRAYLASFGIADAGSRVAEPRDLDLGDARCFAYAGDGGLRLKAIVTAGGMVTPGGHGSDDWYGLLAPMPDARALAEGLAWLETGASATPHGLPREPVAALRPDRRPAAAIDPAQWALVTAPVVRARPGGGVTFVTWLLPSGAWIPERWTVTARRDAPATIVRASAFELLAAGAGVSAAETAARALRSLASGTDDERLWALRQISDTGDRAAMADVAALLADRSVSADVRLVAAATLGHLEDPSAVAQLASSLRADPAPEVRRSCAQALGRIADAGSVRALAAAAPHETDPVARAEIGHALASLRHVEPGGSR